jgi:hypothetical protein
MINNGNTLLKLVPFSPLYADDLQPNFNQTKMAPAFIGTIWNKLLKDLMAMPQIDSNARKLLLEINIFSIKFREMKVVKLFMHFVLSPRIISWAFSPLPLPRPYLHLETFLFV